MTRKPALLIVEDEKNTREGLAHALQKRYSIFLADSAEAALKLLDENEIDLVVTDLRLPGMDGVDFVRRATAHSTQPLCILLTAYGTIETAVEAMRSGAADFLTKPVNLDQLDLVIERAFRSRRLEIENRDLRRQLDKRYGLETLIGQSPNMEALIETIQQVAPTRATVLIQGESGTGKELVARALHQLSTRNKGPFVAVHCAALSPSLLESELFGHEKGSFTGAAERRQGRFELAEGGTLFLDEISEVVPAIQVKLLRVLEERRFERVGGQEVIHADLRLIAATNRDLSQMVADGNFRHDLFFRLNVVTVTIPPLRERVNDIPLFVRHFLRQFTRENKKQINDLSPEAMNALMTYEWPGNVRELRNAIERMVVLARSPQLTLNDVPIAARAAQPTKVRPVHVPGVSLKDVNKHMIIAALAANSGNRSLAARQLGISRRTLHRKINTFGISPRARAGDEPEQECARVQPQAPRNQASP